MEDCERRRDLLEGSSCCLDCSRATAVCSRGGSLAVGDTNDCRGNGKEMSQAVSYGT